MAGSNANLLIGKSEENIRPIRGYANPARIAEQWKRAAKVKISLLEAESFLTATSARCQGRKLTLAQGTSGKKCRVGKLTHDRPNRPFREPDILTDARSMPRDDQNMISGRDDSKGVQTHLERNRPFLNEMSIIANFLGRTQ